MTPSSSTRPRAAGPHGGTGPGARSRPRRDAAVHRARQRRGRRLRRPAGAEPSPHGWERPFNLVMFVFVHARAYPMFAVMFGYGLVQLARRQDERAPVPARRGRCCCGATPG
ncbi:hypothetical protein NKH77_45310 [Streptomyces sp. M19]